ncbi:phosphotransferase [Nocardia asiatica]|uniref:phosphotransferase n=1 Tax=Nocardia asiatica TaxID=209252 RepID=UPI000315CEBC|nr:phosphotransferase [Nocardia asiatica]
MTGSVYVKHYADPSRAAAAAAHHAWMRDLGAVRVPALLESRSHCLVFEHLGHHQPGANDLIRLADAVGRTHHIAHQRHFFDARLDRPVRMGDLLIKDFVSSRRNVLAQAAAPLPLRPVAFYKDSNIRNFLLIDEGVAVIDFDDLTLAPFGYDLAKLIVSTAMTHGRLHPATVEHALGSYNSHLPYEARCSLPSLQRYAEIHHHLTAPYLHRNGYRHSWVDVRPWPPRTSTR